MKLKKLIFAAALACLISGVSHAQEPTPAAPAGADTTDALAHASEAALAWLEDVDKGSYAQSWANAAALFKEAVTEETWIAELQKVRKPLGELSSRQMVASQYATLLPMAPEGEYVVIQFTSRFEGHPTATETVTPMMDPDGNWRVAGYYIK